MAAGISPRHHPGRATLAALALALGALWVYASTLLPGMGLGDTPSFQVMAGSPVISPRDAYPLYFALAFPFVRWLGGDPAHALNLVSALEAAAACGLLLLAAAELSGSVAAAAAAAVLFAGSYTFWSQAVIAEVYALHMLCMALVLLAALHWERQPTGTRLAVLLLVYALGFGNHLTMILLLPGLAAFLALADPRGLRALAAPRTWALGTACALAGALLYTWNARTMWADPAPPRDLTEAIRWFWFDVTKSDWRDTMLMTFPSSMVADRLGMFRFDVHQQFGWTALAGAVVGLVALAVRQRARAVLLTMWLVCNAVFALTYNVGDPHVFLLPVHLVLALFMAVGLAWLADRLARATRPIAAPLAGAAAVGLALTRMVVEYPALDRSDDRRAVAALDRLTADLDDRREILLADLNWQLQNGLNYYGRVLRDNLAFAHTPQVLPYAPRLILDNQLAGRDVVLAGRSRADLEAAYGPILQVRPDPRSRVRPLEERLAAIPEGTRYVLCSIKAPPDLEFDPRELDRALARLTAGHLPRAPAGDFLAVAGLAGRAPALVRSGSRPFTHALELDDLPVRIRMDAWLPFDTIRRMGFGHVIAGRMGARHHALIVERGVSVVALDPSGRPVQTEYAGAIYAPVPRVLVTAAR